MMKNFFSNDDRGMDGGVLNSDKEESSKLINKR